MRVVVPLAALLVAAAGAAAARVTPARGASWLQHLGISPDQTRMGREGGQGAPPPSARREPAPWTPGGGERLDAPFTLTGRDLYRIDCRSCHGPEGRGAPPEINSLLGPVRATSAALLEERQRSAGRRLPPRMAAQLAAEARRTLLDRISNGGKHMPAFHHLQGEEVVALVDHLDALAGVPPAARPPVQVTEPVLRVGEHVVKGTCQICHPATGPGASHMMMYMRGVIPSLASMPRQLSPSAVVGKVRAGAHGGMGGMGMMASMSRMPVFGYLTDEEVMAGYLYLARIPPEP